MEEHQARLSCVVPEILLKAMSLDALVTDGQMKRARALLTEMKEQSRRKAHVDRLTAIIDARDGVDPEGEALKGHTRKQGIS